MKVLLEAYIDDNFGDDLFIKIICERYPTESFYLFDHGYKEETIRRLKCNHNLHFIPVNTNMIECRLFDLFLLIGGDMFPNNIDLKFREMIIDKRIEYGKPVHIIGCNLHRSYSEASLNIILKMFQKASYVAVRDEWSYNFLKERLPENNIYHSSDIAFSYDINNIKKIKKSGLLGISVRRKTSLDDEIYTEYCAYFSSIINVYLEKDNQNQVTFFCFSSGKVKDEETAKDILLGVNDHDRVKIKSYLGEINSYMNSFSECESIIATRFHALVMALILHIPFIPFAYESKLNNLLLDITYEGILLDYENMKTPPVDVLKQLSKDKQPYDVQKLGEYLRRSAINFNLLDKILKKSDSVKGNVEDNPLVSIILPTYNGNKYIKESIISCLNQTYRNIELIVVDDCSTDNTLETINKIAVRDNRLKVIRHYENKKLPAALNTGFSIAKGQYFTWTSDDNIYGINAIEEMVKKLQNNIKIDVIYADYAVIDENNDVRAVQVLDENIDNILIENIIGACFLYKRQVHEQLGGYNEEEFLVEDYDFWLRASLIFKFKKISKVLYYYRCHTASLSTTKNKEVMLKRVQIIDKILPKLSNIKREILYKMYITLAEDVLWVFKDRDWYIDLKTTAFLISPDLYFPVENPSELAQELTLVERLIIKLPLIRTLYGYEQPVYLWGTNEESLQVYKKLRQNGFDIEGFVDDTKISRGILKEKGIFRSDVIVFPEIKVKIIIATKEDRDKIEEKLKQKGFISIQDYILI